MYKTRSKSKRIISIGICICSICFSYISAGKITGYGLFDDLLKIVEQSAPIDKIFDGDTAVENLYSKSLKMVKSQNTNILKNGIQEVTQAISQQSDSPIKQQDVMNILYDTNVAVSKIAAVMNTLAKRSGIRQIPEEEINMSYKNVSQKIPSCIKDVMAISTLDNEERACIKKRIGEQYYNIQSSEEDNMKFKMDNYGEDFFTNGSLEDSEYDLLKDIENIGTLLFTSFIGPKETLFYKMPQSKSSNIDSTLNAMANILGGGNGSTMTPIEGERTTSSGTSNNSGSSNSNNGSNNNGSNNNGSNNEDTDLENFIKSSTTQNINSSSNTTSNNVSVLGTAQGNMCIPSVSAGNSNTTTTTTITTIETTTIQEYLDDIEKETDETTPNSDYSPTPIIDTNTEDMTSEEITAMNQLIEEKIDNIFDEESTKKCTDKCTVGTLSEQTICKIECLCFSIQYPKTGLVGLDGQLKLRFCTIPVEKNRVSKQKDILGWDDSLSRIKSVFENLTNGGEMIKYERPKEYLDSSLGAIKRAKYISFEIKVYIKSLFGTVDNKARQIKANKETEKTNERAKGSTPQGEINRDKYKLSDAEDVNKSQTAANTYTQNKIKEQINKNLEEVVKNAKNKKAIMFNEQVSKFLEENSNFWFQISEQMIDLNKKTATIKNKLNALN